MKTIITNIISSYKHIPYTWKHYLAFLKVEKKLLGCYKYKFHDWDKLGMYIVCPFLGTKKIGKIHRFHSSHHVKNKTEEVDWIEAVIDWECAGLTKPDKPLTARQTMEKWYPEYKEHIEPVLQKLGL